MCFYSKLNTSLPHFIRQEHRKVVLYLEGVPNRTRVNEQCFRAQLAFSSSTGRVCTEQSVASYQAVIRAHIGVTAGGHQEDWVPAMACSGVPLRKQTWFSREHSLFVPSVGPCRSIPRTTVVFLHNSWLLEKILVGVRWLWLQTRLQGRWLSLPENDSSGIFVNFEHFTLRAK